MSSLIPKKPRIFKVASKLETHGFVSLCPNFVHVAPIVNPIRIFFSTKPGASKSYPYQLDLGKHLQRNQFHSFSIIAVPRAMQWDPINSISAGVQLEHAVQLQIMSSQCKQISISSLQLDHLLKHPPPPCPEVLEHPPQFRSQHAFWLLPAAKVPCVLHTHTLIMRVNFFLICKIRLIKISLHPCSNIF